MPKTSQSEIMYLPEVDKDLLANSPPIWGEMFRQMHSLVEVVGHNVDLRAARRENERDDKINRALNAIAGAVQELRNNLDVIQEDQRGLRLIVTQIMDRVDKLQDDLTHLKQRVGVESKILQGVVSGNDLRDEKIEDLKKLVSAMQSQLEKLTGAVQRRNDTGA